MSAASERQTVAYLVHPSQPEVTADALLAKLQGANVEVARVAEYTVILRHR